MILKLNEELHQGILITFCGLDGCGKTTMINLLAEYLKNNFIDVVLTKQPTKNLRESAMFRTFMDAEDNSSYDYRALSLCAASDRIQHTNKYIIPLLGNGETVISDRYYYSCVANHRARGYDDQWIYEIASYIQKPNYSFFLDVDVETAISRIRKRKSEKDKYIDIPLQYKLRYQYLKIAEECGGIIIRSDGEIKDCFEQIIKNINNILVTVSEKKQVEL